MADHDLTKLGPLARLAGVWRGSVGNDLAPARAGVATHLDREHLVLTPIRQVNNRDQILHGLRYATTAWRADAIDSFHQEVGYWLYEPSSQLVMRCFIVPRGITVLAGGKAAPDADSFELSAELGSPTFGISSNP